MFCLPFDKIVSETEEAMLSNGRQGLPFNQVLTAGGWAGASPTAGRGRETEQGAEQQQTNHCKTARA